MAGDKLYRVHAKEGVAVSPGRNPNTSGIGDG